MNHPEPQVRARVAEPDQIPRGAKRLLKAMQEADWKHVTTYARGNRLERSGEPGPVVESVLVSGALIQDHDGVRIVAKSLIAEWVDGSHTKTWAWGPAGLEQYLKGIGANDAVKWIKGEVDPWERESDLGRSVPHDHTPR